MLRAKATVSMWGNSQALRIPVEMTRRLGICANDEVVLEVRENILTVSKPTTPREGTIEYLFKDYSGVCFKTELTNPIEPVGREDMINNVPMQGDIIKINLDPKQGHEQKGYRPYICLSHHLVSDYANIAVFAPISNTSRRYSKTS